MKTDVMVVNNQSLPVQTMNDFKFIGTVIQQSGILKCRTEAEGIAVAFMCHQKGMSFMEWNEKYHLIKGQTTKKTQAIQADFQRAGGEVEIHEHTADCASATFSIGKTKYTSTIRWEDALKEPFVYAGKEDDVIRDLDAGRTPKLKAKYATPRSRSQMLWARCVSDGVRVVYPAACEGIYTPEETSDFTGANSEPVRAAQPVPVAMTAVAEPVPVVEAEIVSDDPDIITIQGSLYGQRYSAQPTETLQWALDSNAPQITAALTPAVREHLINIISERMQNAN